MCARSSQLTRSYGQVGNVWGRKKNRRNKKHLRNLFSPALSMANGEKREEGGLDIARERNARNSQSASSPIRRFPPKDDFGWPATIPSLIHSLPLSRQNTNTGDTRSFGWGAGACMQNACALEVRPYRAEPASIALYHPSLCIGPIEG